MTDFPLKVERRGPVRSGGKEFRVLAVPGRYSAVLVAVSGLCTAADRYGAQLLRGVTLSFLASCFPLRVAAYGGFPNCDHYSC
jgi:hypothetical protein